MAKSASGGLFKLATALILLSGAVAAVLFGIAVYEIFCERNEIGNRVNTLAQNALKMKHENEYKKEYHARLVNDEDFAQRVIRETLGYSAENEIIFKFDEKTFSAKSGRGVSVEQESAASDRL